MGDLAGKTFVVTGANTGVGRATAEALGARGATVWLACRSVDKAGPVAETIERAGGAARVVQLDLSDLASVREAAARLDRDLPRLDALIANAGLAGARGRTKDGFEVAFGTNHLGHFLLTLALVEKLRASAPARVVVVASRAHYRARGVDWAAAREATRSRTAFPEYGVSKLCNVLFARELGRRLAGTGVTTYALHPGVVASDIWRRLPAIVQPLVKLFMITNEEGAKTSVHCATAPELAGETGKYYDSCRETRPGRAALDDALARELWEKSLAWSGAPDVPAPKA